MFRDESGGLSAALYIVCGFRNRVYLSLFVSLFFERGRRKILSSNTYLMGLYLEGMRFYLVSRQEDEFKLTKVTKVTMAL